MPKISAQARAARRQDFIDAAWRLLARASWRDLAVDDICAEAAASKGAFYGYFERKQDLLHALLDDEATAMEHLLADLVARKLPAAQQLRRFTRDTLTRAADPARVQLRADLWAALGSEPTTRERFAATVHRQRMAVRELIERGINAGELAEVPRQRVGLDPAGPQRGPGPARRAGPQGLPLDQCLPGDGRRAGWRPTLTAGHQPIGLGR